ncbi:MAG: transposase, partial [Candidatus Hydrogenedentes bacterium]|nr:transposase [Candidatus Hydrogenedentota bacterium]
MSFRTFHYVGGLGEGDETASSIWVKKRAPELHDSAWQSGYGTFSVSVSNIESVKAYISDQKEHHKK